MDPVAELEQQLRQNSFFVQASLEQHGKLTSKLDAFVTGLIDLLIERDVVSADELAGVVAANRRQQAEAASTGTDDTGDFPPWPTVVVREDPTDATGSSNEPAAPVNCAERMAICRAACCSLPFPLSAKEVEAGKVKWDLGHPYLIRHSDQGYCVHNDRAAGACAVYEDRPQVCHSYSCANDTRIWKNFDDMVLNEDFLQHRRRRQFTFTPVSPDAVPVAIARREPGATALSGSVADVPSRLAG